NSHITIKMEDLRGRFAAQGAMISRIRNNFIASANERFLAFNPETEEKQEQLRREVVETEKVRPGSFYFGPTGRAYGEIHSKDGDPGARFWSVGGLMGVDYAFSEVGIGAMADYERIFVHAKDNWGSIDVDELHASIYLTYSPSCIPLAINAIGGGAYEFYSIRRNTSTGKVRGKPNGFGYDALFGFEYAIGGCNFHFIPLANAQYIYLRAEKFNEKGSAGIHIDSQRVKSLRSSVGFRLNYYNDNSEDLIVIPEFYAEWQREYMNRSRDLGVAPIAGIGGTILLPGTGRNIWLGGVDLLFTYRQKFGVELSYETEYNSLYHDHFFYLGANFRF
ncbi:MAG TPA: autotransporter outer membrane beta-barrel domain-containing protein, partial [Chlamydiales bacterium]|nr:autotransporter outer membrane beta-barrel domain-containing protein [Chlamydiales bacterium]